MDNRRDFHRLQLWGLADASVTAKNFEGNVKIYNISAKGILLNFPKEMYTNNIVDIEFVLEGKVFIRSGKVVHCHKSANTTGFEVGVEFIQSNKEQVEIFRTLFAVAAKTSNIN